MRQKLFSQPASLSVFSRSAIQLLALSLVFSSLAGCGGQDSDTPETAPVTGVVKLDGQPLPDATVVFEPEAGRPSQADTDAEGKYSLRYTKDLYGAKIGKHTVRITTGKQVTNPDDTITTVPEKVPAMYNSKTTLKKDVAAPKTTIDFDLKSK